VALAPELGLPFAFHIGVEGVRRDWLAFRAAALHDAAVELVLEVRLPGLVREELVIGGATLVGCDAVLIRPFPAHGDLSLRMLAPGRDGGGAPRAPARAASRGREGTGTVPAGGRAVASAAGGPRVRTRRRTGSRKRVRSWGPGPGIPRPPGGESARRTGRSGRGRARPRRRPGARGRTARRRPDPPAGCRARSAPGSPGCTTRCPHP